MRATGRVRSNSVVGTIHVRVRALAHRITADKSMAAAWDRQSATSTSDTWAVTMTRSGAQPRAHGRGVRGPHTPPPPPLRPPG